MSEQEDEQSSEGWLEELRNQPIYSPPPTIFSPSPLDFSPPPITSVFMSPQVDFSPPPPITSVLVSPTHYFSPPPTPSALMSLELNFIRLYPSLKKPTEFFTSLGQLRTLTIMSRGIVIPLPRSFTGIYDGASLVRKILQCALPVSPSFSVDLVIIIVLDFFVALPQLRSLTIQGHNVMPNLAASELDTVVELDHSSMVQVQEFVNSHTNGKLDSRRQRNQKPQPATSSPQPIASPDVGEMGQLHSSEQQSLVPFIAINYRSNLLVAKKKNKRDTLDREYISLEDVLQRIGSGHEEYVESLEEKDEERMTQPLRCSSRGFNAQDCCLVEERSVEVIGDVTLNLRSQCQPPPWPIDLPHGREIVKLDSSDLHSSVKFDATNNGAHVVEAYQNFPTVSHSEKENARDKSKRRYGSNSVLTLQDLQPHFVRKREDAAKSLDISVPTLKRICRQHGIHRWPFQPERKKGRSMEVISPSVHEKLDSRLQCIEISMPARSSPQILALPDSGEMVQLDSSEKLSLVEFDATNNGAHLVTTASHSDEKSSRETLKRKCETEGVLSFEDLQQHFVGRRDDAAKALGVSVSTVKRICRQHGILWWPSWKKNNVSKPNYIPLEPKRDKNASSTCKTPTDGQAETGNEMVGHLQEQNGVLPNFIEGPNLSNIENGSKEKNIEALTFQDSFPGNYPAIDYLSISSTYKESGEAGGSSELAFQPNESIAYPNPNVGSSKDLRNFSTSAVEAFIEGHVSESVGTVPSSSDPVPTQAMTTIPHIMPHLTERQDLMTVVFKAKYRHHTIRFDLSLTSGIVELNEEVTKRLKLELGSFDVMYQDEDNDWVLIACDADLRNCFKLSSSSGNQTIRLLIRDKVANSKNSRKSCRGLESKRS